MTESLVFSKKGDLTLAAYVDDPFVSGLSKQEVDNEMDRNSRIIAAKSYHQKWMTLLKAVISLAPIYSTTGKRAG